MSCSCNTGSLADEAGRKLIKDLYANTKNISIIDKVVANPVAVGAGIFVGGVATILGLKFAKKLK